MISVDELKKRLVDNIDLSKNISDEELNGMITEMVTEATTGKRVSLKEKMRISKALFNSIRGLDILQDLLETDEVTEIMVNGFNNIFIEKAGKISRYKESFTSEEKLMDIIQNIAARSNKRVNESSPVLDTRLDDGSRVNIVLKPVAINGPIVTIRKFPEQPIDMKHLQYLGSITWSAAEYLKQLVINKYNIFISGGTGSGKTTMLNALSNFIPDNERIITIEDSAELKLQNIGNLVSLECRQANAEGENAVTIRDLIRTSLRMRPDRIVVGEVRGGEALDMLQAMNTGHEGSISTGHANSPKDMLSRLEVMTMMAGEDIPLQAIKSQIASAIDIIVHLERQPDGKRRVSCISQIEGMKDGEIMISSLFEINEDPPSFGKLQWTGIKLKRIKGNMENEVNYDYSYDFFDL